MEGTPTRPEDITTNTTPAGSPKRLTAATVIDSAGGSPHSPGIQYVALTPEHPPEATATGTYRASPTTSAGAAVAVTPEPAPSKSAAELAAETKTAAYM